MNGTLQPGAVRKTKLPFYRLVGAVFNCAYSVLFLTAPTGPDKSGSKPKGESQMKRNADLRSLRIDLAEAK